MLSIEKKTVPMNSLLDKYSSLAGAYLDCYVTEINKQTSFPEYIFAFYTTALFKVERFILKYAVSKPATKLDAKNLSNGVTDKFAAWTVEDRRENELLLCDFKGSTRSWLMIENEGVKTKLYFGSAVVPKTGSVNLDFGFRALLRFHQIYSILLLYFAKKKILYNKQN